MPRPLMLVVRLLPQLLYVVIQLQEAGWQAGAVAARVAAGRLPMGAALELLAQLRTAVLQEIVRGAVRDLTQATA